MSLRKQYYFGQSDRGLMAWDVDRLVALSAGFPRRPIRVDALPIDHDWSDDVEGHARLVAEADLSFPVILASNGAVMDGRHRIAKARQLGLTSIDAVQFEVDPPPDYVGVEPDQLPYD